MTLSRSLPRFLVIISTSTLTVCGGSSPTQAPTPGPTATAAPTPTPAATPLPPLNQACTHLGAGSASARCPREHASFQSEVDSAIDEVRAKKPEIFDGTKVLSTGQFLVAIIKALDARGVCAGWDGEELAVKNSDDFNDQYDILTVAGTVRWGTGSYRVTCYPAAFPLNVSAPAATPDCPNLPPSRELTCGRETSRFYPDVEAATGQVLKEHPEFFDFNDLAARTDWPKIVNHEGYIQATIQILKGKGYCARWDGEELAVKNTSDYNEQFAIVYAHIWVRRGEGSYRTTCYPSAF
jgi:hypothetical protein